MYNCVIDIVNMVDTGFFMILRMTINLFDCASNSSHSSINYGVLS